MSFDPLKSDKPLIVYIDYKSPYAFVAKDATYALEEDFGIEIDWRPFTLDIPSYLGSARLDKKGKVAESNRTPEQWGGVKYAYKDARRYAAMQGYELRGTVKIWDTTLVHIVMLWAKGQSREVLRACTDRLYERFWRRAFDAEDLQVVLALLRECGAQTDGFEAWAEGPGREEHDQIQKGAFEAGIFGVPTYVIDGEFFFGREHLPYIRWCLGGRQGPAPDVANDVPAAALLEASS